MYGLNFEQYKANPLYFVLSVHCLGHLSHVYIYTPCHILSVIILDHPELAK